MEWRSTLNEAKKYMNYMQYILRIYMSDGSTSYNDEITEESIKINYPERRKWQTWIICLLLIFFSICSKLNYGFAPIYRATVIIYLIIDIIMLKKRVTFNRERSDYPYYMDMGHLKIYRSNIVGGVNIMMFLLLFID